MLLYLTKNIPFKLRFNLVQMEAPEHILGDPVHSLTWLCWENI